MPGSGGGEEGGEEGVSAVRAGRVVARESRKAAGARGTGSVGMTPPSAVGHSSCAAVASPAGEARSGWTGRAVTRANVVTMAVRRR